MVNISGIGNYQQAKERRGGTMPGHAIRSIHNIAESISNPSLGVKGFSRAPPINLDDKVRDSRARDLQAANFSVPNIGRS